MRMPLKADVNAKMRGFLADVVQGEWCDEVGTKTILFTKWIFTFRKERLGEETNGFLSQEKKFTFSTWMGDFEQFPHL